MGANFCIVGLTAPNLSEGLYRNPSGMKEFCTCGVRGSHIRCESMPFIQPIRLSKLSDNQFLFLSGIDEEITTVPDTITQLFSCCPVGINQCIHIEGIGFISQKSLKFKFFFRENILVDGCLVSTLFCCAKGIKKLKPCGFVDFADPTNRIQGPLAPLFH